MQLFDCLVAVVSADREAVGSLHDIEYLCVDQEIRHSVRIVAAESYKSGLSRLLAHLHRFHSLVRYGCWSVPGMQMPYVDIIRAQLRQARVQILQNILFSPGGRLGCDMEFAAVPAFDHTGKYFFAVAVIAGGIEIIYTHIQGTCHDFRYRHKSDSKADTRNFQPGFS